MSSLTVAQLTTLVYTDAEKLIANKKMTKASDLIALVPALMKLTYDAYTLVHVDDLTTVLTNVLQMIADKYVDDASEKELLMNLVAPALADIVEGIQSLHMSASFKASFKSSFRCCYGKRVTKQLPK